MLLPHRVGPMEPVQPRDVTIVARELLVVVIVEGGLVVEEQPGPMVPTMVRLSAKHGENHPHEYCVNVGSEWNGAAEQGDQIREDHLDRVAVCRHEPDWRGEFVMHLVTTLVDRLVMKQAVAVVEEDLIREDVKHRVQRHLLSGGHLRRDRARPTVDEPRYNRCKADRHDNLVEQQIAHDLADLGDVESLVLLDLILLEHLGPVHRVDHQQDKPV
mmetsp:Transcript_53819/g.163452  ORF Transcript_53819/g.163452 Transcript_53819/m.163452 type:complete len:215 (+) Transcript_53819:204-848(+)